MAPLLQNLCLSMGDNEEACFCLKVGVLHTVLWYSIAGGRQDGYVL
jgi:hypothetical protein